ncbi:hypothetical protein SVI_1148 [Shewanella violacea DSS12]|uniref:Uncharacterized protein n=1 Tax=Shewanella violacea (strain JCM 10179 / CIP 106290 / LMG 19151 / DSS12) TaxID=637905 RepID=D4ZHH0_SHEVD|nr:hypothetical protein SVI_1148 [Shewanella violacea DSS12]
MNRALTSIIHQIVTFIFVALYPLMYMGFIFIFFLNFWFFMKTDLD